MTFAKIPVVGLLAAVCLLAAPARAADETLGLRTIQSIGCHSVDGTCFVVLSGAYFGASCGPLYNQVRWDDADQPNGKRTFAALYGAFLAGRSVDVTVNGCTKQGFPKIVYFYVY